MCVLRRVADIANAAVKRARPSPHSSPSATPPLLSDAELANLTNAVARVTPDHLAVHSHDYDDDLLPTPPNLIGYVSVAEQQNFTMAVFIMPPGAEIPLHDHANMYVVTNVLWGTLEVHEYEPLVPDNISGADTVPAKKQPVSVLEAGNVRSLTPSRGNIHSFRSRDWTAVFDVLVPPYDSYAGRSCNYYTPIREHTLQPVTADDNRFILKVRLPIPVLSKLSFTDLITAFLGSRHISYHLY